jgi:hypothetical protein
MCNRAKKCFGICAELLVALAKIRYSVPSPVIPSVMAEGVGFFSKLERITAKQIGKTTPSNEMIRKSDIQVVELC